MYEPAEGMSMWNVNKCLAVLQRSTLEVLEILMNISKYFFFFFSVLVLFKEMSDSSKYMFCCVFSSFAVW